MSDDGKRPFHVDDGEEKSLRELISEAVHIQGAADNHKRRQAWREWRVRAWTWTWKRSRELGIVLGALTAAFLLADAVLTWAVERWLGL